ncbi:uncharacterized protein LOC112568150 [Pomacea canaliculata]|uniref:uncharacterized protein LOC112568150 n=1 Tax=Pomacea canaliculata TaxID=400727 RepID=UPI000D73CC8D|nr:uncharacterized protein LOC112568150 [Pomacea canaliculata]
MASWRLWMLCLAALLVLEGHCGVQISNCVNGSVDIAEDTSPSFTCGTIRSGWINWLADDLHIGSCNKDSCILKSNIYKLRSESSSAGLSSELTITKIDRFTARRLVCLYTGTECRLRVFAPARIVPENCIITISNWRVQGSCQVENMFMLSDNYICTWRENSTKIPGDFQGHRQYYGNLSKTYWKEVCSFTKLMPVHQSKFTYGIEINPGHQDFFVETINIILPEKPEYNCTDTVIEGSNVTCICTSLNMGNPPASLAWDGKTDGILLLQNVGTENDNSIYTCRLTWGPNGFINHTIVYTLRVVESEQASAADLKRWMIGGVVATVIIITIIGALIVVYMVKRRKDRIHSSRGVKLVPPPF